MRLVLRTQALQSKIEGKPPFSDNPDDYQVIIDGPSIGRIYLMHGHHMPSTQWRWALQVPPYGSGYAATLDEAKAALEAAYKPKT